MDDVRDTILQRYGNSLGRTIDAADVTLWIVSRTNPPNERTIGPEESMSQILSSYYPGGQSVDEALVIEVGVNSPEPIDFRMHLSPVHPGFPRMDSHQTISRSVSPSSPRSRIETPAGLRKSSAGLLNTALPESPVRLPPVSPTPQLSMTRSEDDAVLGTPSGQFEREQEKRTPRWNADPLDGPAPNISVLIVDDNDISLRTVVQQVKHLGVRWETAANGQIAVDKWRTSGYHLILMDIHMPVMNGLEATKTIRRLEKVNAIGNLSRTASTISKPAKEEDILEHKAKLFKSSVIIVALTASSLDSDRREALNAGCNDFLTKPVDKQWLKRKVKEWGCMQALVDFDGWRTWKDGVAEET